MSNKIKRKGGAAAPKKKPARTPEQGAAASTPWITWALRIGGVVAAVGLVAFFMGTSTGARAEPPEGVIAYDAVERGHVTETVDYEQSPPPGGEHNPIWANCGFYSTPMPTENVVHSMEHGAVWIAYRADLLTDGQLGKIRDLAQKTDVIATPYEDQDEPIVATAWGVQLPLDDADDDRLDQFVSAYRKGPQTPEPNATCSGGVGNPET